MPLSRCALSRSPPMRVGREAHPGRLPRRQAASLMSASSSSLMSSLLLRWRPRPIEKAPIHHCGRGPRSRCVVPPLFAPITGASCAGGNRSRRDNGRNPRCGYHPLASPSGSGVSGAGTHHDASSLWRRSLWMRSLAHVPIRAVVSARSVARPLAESNVMSPGHGPRKCSPFDLAADRRM